MNNLKLMQVYNVSYYSYTPSKTIVNICIHKCIVKEKQTRQELSFNIYINNTITCTANKRTGRNYNSEKQKVSIL